MAAGFDRVLCNDSQGGHPDDVILAGMQKKNDSFSTDGPGGIGVGSRQVEIPVA
jgi:hypothetical protein